MRSYNAHDWARALEAAIAATGLNEGSPDNRATDSEVARILGKGIRTVGRWRSGDNLPSKDDRAVYLGRLAAVRPAGAARPSTALRDAVAHHAPTTPRTFETESERKAYALGVLDLAQVSVGEASRAITSASAALLAPLTPLAPAFPSSGETQSRHSRFAQASDAQPPGRAVAPAQRPARKKA